jgi:hypothetical protein
MSLAIGRDENVILVAHGRNDPTNAEWAAYLALVARLGVEGTKRITWTPWGWPTRAQRRALEQLVAGRSVPMAVVSPSVWVRITVTVLSWFVPRLRAFPPGRLLDALLFLEVPRSRKDRIARELRKLRVLAGEDVPQLGRGQPRQGEP